MLIRLACTRLQAGRRTLSMKFRRWTGPPHLTTSSNMIEHGSLESGNIVCAKVRIANALQMQRPICGQILWHSNIQSLAIEHVGVAGRLRSSRTTIALRKNLLESCLYACEREPTLAYPALRSYLR